MLHLTKLVFTYLVVKAQCKNARSSAQQIIPTLFARDRDTESLDVLFHLLRSLFHRMQAKEILHVGFKLCSRKTDDPFAHARDGIVRVLTQHFFPMLLHERPSLFSCVPIEKNVAHEVGGVLC